MERTGTVDTNLSPDAHIVTEGSDMGRPTLDEYFMAMAELVSRRSTCLRRQVGAIAVKNKHIISTGYNGAPKRLRHCSEVGCIREELDVKSGERHELCRGVHAEQNAIIQAAVFGTSIDGAQLYCTHTPCAQCAKILINAGIKEVVYAAPYIDALAKELLDESDVRVRQFSFARARAMD